MWFRLLMICLSSAGVAGMLQDRADAQSVPAPAPASAPAAQPGASAKPADTGSPSAAPVVAPSVSQPGGGGIAGELVVPVGREGYVYLPEGRRDPFLMIIREAGAADMAKKSEDVNLPPLQRVSVSELSVIGIVWGGFGYMAMVQTPDGKGYAVQRGAKIGNNNGIVSAITEKAVIVEERFTDIYGKKQVREYAKPLHAKESLP